jgi:hypothetical protein
LEWGEQILESNRVQGWRLGALRIWIKRTGKEVWIASMEVPDESAKNFEEHELNWNRWGVRRELRSLFFSPALPPRPVVVKPELPFRLMANADAQIYIRLPAWLVISLTGKKDSELASIPTATLSKTWFGDFGAGEACFWMSSRVRRDVLTFPVDTSRITCPVHVLNRSAEELLIDKMCFRSRAVGIYQTEGSERGQELWASDTRVTYRGGESLSTITTSTGAPREKKDARLLTEAIEKQDGVLTALTFKNLLKFIYD